MLDSTLFMAAAGGFITGMRSMTLPALLSRRLRPRDVRRVHPALTPLVRPPAPDVLAVLAAGELVADKTPFVPDRTAPPALAGRIAIGGVCGALIGARRGGPRVASALVGALAAAGSTFLSYHARKYAAERTGIPDPVYALVEDTLVLTAAYSLTEGL